MSLSLFTRPLYALTFRFAYGHGKPEFIIREAQLIYQGNSSEVYRGKLFQLSEFELEGKDVVCKVAYRSQAVACLEHEATMYIDNLSHLQGVCIPICHGYFVNEERMNWRSCLILDYAGEPVKKAFAELDVTFKRALVHAATLFHDAGAKHCNWDEENVLDNDGLPMIIDLETVQDHKCTRQDIVEGALAPRIQDFQCPELYQLCETLKYWKPGMIKYNRGYVPITIGMSAEELVATTLPRYLSHDIALKRAKKAIKRHVELHYPERYEEWKRKRARSRSQSSSQTTGSSATSSRSSEANAAPSR